MQEINKYLQCSLNMSASEDPSKQAIINFLGLSQKIKQGQNTW